MIYSLFYISTIVCVLLKTVRNNFKTTAVKMRFAVIIAVLAAGHEYTGTTAMPVLQAASLPYDTNNVDYSTETYIGPRTTSEFPRDAGWDTAMQDYDGSTPAAPDAQLLNSNTAVVVGPPSSSSSVYDYSFLSAPQQNQQQQYYPSNPSSTGFRDSSFSDSPASSGSLTNSQQQGGQISGVSITQQQQQPASGFVAATAEAGTSFDNSAIFSQLGGPQTLTAQDCTKAFPQLASSSPTQQPQQPQQQSTIPQAASITNPDMYSMCIALMGGANSGTSTSSSSPSAAAASSDPALAACYANPTYKSAIDQASKWTAQQTQAWMAGPQAQASPDVKKCISLAYPSKVASGAGDGLSTVDTGVPSGSFTPSAESCASYKKAYDTQLKTWPQEKIYAWFAGPDPKKDPNIAPCMRYLFMLDGVVIPPIPTST